MSLEKLPPLVPVHGFILAPLTHSFPRRVTPPPPTTRCDYKGGVILELHFINTILPAR